jgi:hypothetical protein
VSSSSKVPVKRWEKSGAAAIRWSVQTLSANVIWDARDAARVEVVLEQGRFVSVEADDCHPVRGVRMFDLPSLNEELSSR